MGAALRHATEKMAGITARSRHMILLSDGFPQDFDYGQDRRSNLYGLRDTTIALREAEAAGIVPFCITVDKSGHDYLREMCDESRYMVIETSPRSHRASQSLPTSSPPENGLSLFFGSELEGRGMIGRS
jgi:nitric oxide reductase activation protein